MSSWCILRVHVTTTNHHPIPKRKGVRLPAATDGVRFRAAENGGSGLDDKKTRERLRLLPNRYGEPTAAARFRTGRNGWVRQTEVGEYQLTNGEDIGKCIFRGLHATVGVHDGRRAIAVRGVERTRSDRETDGRTA